MSCCTLSVAVLDILLHQTSPKIFVGDPHQQIYSFRGAVNAIDMIVPTHSYYLTKVRRLLSLNYISWSVCIDQLFYEHPYQCYTSQSHLGRITDRTCICCLLSSGSAKVLRSKQTFLCFKIILKVWKQYQSCQCTCDGLITRISVPQFHCVM